MTCTRHPVLELLRGYRPHGDPEAADVERVTALAEAAEETGLADLAAWPDAALRQVVVVGVPARGREPAHEHADLRFVLGTGSPGAIRAETPDAPLRWLSVAQAWDLTSEANLRDMLSLVQCLLDS